MTWNKTAIRSHGLPFDGLNPCNPCNYMEYYSFTDPGWVEGWAGLVGWPIADTSPTKWSPVNHRSGIGQESPPAKHRRHNHRATPPSNVVYGTSIRHTSVLCETVVAQQVDAVGRCHVKIYMLQIQQCGKPHTCLHIPSLYRASSQQCITNMQQVTVYVSEAGYWRSA